MATEIKAANPNAKALMSAWKLIFWNAVSVAVLTAVDQLTALDITWKYWALVQPGLVLVLKSAATWVKTRKEAAQAPS